MTHHKRAETACRFNRGDILVAVWRIERKKRRIPKDQRQTSCSLWSLWTARSPTDERFRGRCVHPYLKSTKLPIQKEAQAQSRWRPCAPDVANDPRGRTGVIPCGGDAPHMKRTSSCARPNTPAPHRFPACITSVRFDLQPFACRASSPAHAVETFLLARCDHSLVRRAQGNCTAADVALVVPVLASQEIHRSPRTPGIASGSDGGLTCELPLPTASLLAPDRLL